MASIYEDGTYLQKNPDWHEGDSSWKSVQVKHILSRNKLVPKIICDVGCGTGEVLRQLAADGPASAQYVGYDISPQAIEIAKRKEQWNLGFRLGNLPAPEEERFDLVICMDVFEHVENYFSFLRDVRDIATYKVFHIPLDLSVQTVLRKGALLQRRSDIGHIHYFTKEVALAILRDTGYEVVDNFYTHKFCDGRQVGLFNNILKLFLKTLFAVQEDFAARVVGFSSLMVLAK